MCNSRKTRIAITIGIAHVTIKVLDVVLLFCEFLEIKRSSIDVHFVIAWPMYDFARIGATTQYSGGVELSGLRQTVLQRSCQIGNRKRSQLGMRKIQRGHGYGACNLVTTSTLSSNAWHE
jgi:hypothetical protein